MITKTQYLYGIDVDPSSWFGMAYEDVLNRKIILADDRITELYKVPMMQRSSDNINDCLRAIKFNEELLKELYEK